MTAADFGIIRELAYQHTGIVLPERKRHMVYSRLSRRLRLLRLANFGEYCLKLQSDPLELAPFINALTTNLTSFFRERHHFNFLETELVPYWQQRKQRRLRVWSAACSSGEEPYSIAMTLAEHFPAASGWDLKILATDLDTNVLARAEAGVYPWPEWRPSLNDGTTICKAQRKSLVLATRSKSYSSSSSSTYWSPGRCRAHSMPSSAVMC